MLIPHAPNLDLDGLTKYINSVEKPTVEFLTITAQDPNDASTNNIFNFVEGGDPVSRTTVAVMQVDPDLDEHQVANWVSGQMDQGLNPICYADVNIPGGTISVVVFRNAGGHGAPDDEGYTYTKASVFGLEMDGVTKDPDDSGFGSPVFGKIKTSDPTVVGAAIPEPVAISKFGSLPAAAGHKVEVINLANNKKIVCDIVDFGPQTGPGSPVSKGVALDLTYKAHINLGDKTGMVDVKYRVV